LSSEYRCLSQPEICSGDQFSLSLFATHSRRRRSTANLHSFGRHARFHAAPSASEARYFDAPPLRATSREIVDTERFKPAAMLRRDSSRLIPREISSRSASVSARLLLLRAGGEIPPEAATNPNTEPGGFANARAMSLSDCPCRQRRHSSVLPCTSKPRFLIATQHLLLDPHVRCHGVAWTD